MKKFRTAVAAIMLVLFMASAVVTVALADPPGCKRCRKEGCPQGYCYFDCESCCYLYFHQVYCFK